MRPRARAIVVAVAFSAASCASTAPSAPVPFTRLAPFPVSGLSASALSPGQQVIRDADTWAAVWTSLTSQTTPAPPLPSVDFTTSVVLFTTMGRQPSSGYRTSISAVTSGAVEQLLVSVDQTTPGASCVVTPAMTSPADAVVVSREAASFVEFKVIPSVHECGS